MPKLQLGYPKRISDADGVRNEYKYLDATSTLKTHAQSYPPGKNYTDGMPIVQVVLERYLNTSKSELLIVTALTKGQTTNPTGTGAGDDQVGVLPPPEVELTDPLPNQTSTEVFTGEVRKGAAGVDNEYPFYEIDWAQVEKSLRQHPAFAAFTAAELNQLQVWEDEVDGAARAAFQYWNKDSAGVVTGTIQTLSTDQQDYAKLRLLGVEGYLDFAPVARKVSRFRGNTTPATSDAGQKITGDPFADVPTGYEWVKIADGSSKQGEGSDWVRTEQWQGSRLVLLDKDELFLP